MKILVDAMGGDKAPLEPIKGAIEASESLNCKVALVGRKTTILEVCEKNGLDINGIEIFNAEDVVEMCDPPISVRSKENSSMRVGFSLLKEGKVDAFVSAGNTGALHCGSTLFVHRIKGIQRSAIATIIALQCPMLLVDSGANSTVTADHLVQFAQMGTVYMKNIFGIESPRVGLLNIGSESTKGTDMHVEAYKKLSETDGINFVGNIEGNDVPYGHCDVLVTDGFNGNIILKLMEGFSKFLVKNLKSVFMKNVFNKVSALVLKKSIKSMLKSFDASEYGGAPFLGISKPVIKAHGNSDSSAIKNAVRQAVTYAETGIILEIARQNDSLVPACEKSGACDE